jgi:ATP-binding cassette subfamily B protein
MGILFQQYAQYRLPVKESIAQGDSQKKFSFAEVKEAAKQSESAEFIESWPDKYDQMLGREFSGGLDPSIGQWQKLALARVFYRKPSVFVLDEPTASIDAEAEAHIFERLEKVAAGKTMLLISHRFSTVRKADTICVIKNGRVHEQGTHVGLLAKKGTYAKLFHLQAKGYE